MSSDRGELCLLVRAASQLQALPLSQVEETMRPLPVQPLAGVPPFVLGVSVIRGAAVPVVDSACAAGAAAPSSGVTRFVTIKLADRRAALAVDDVIGLTRIDQAQLSLLPSLLAGASERVASIGTLDSELLLMLQSSKLVPDDVWKAIESGVWS